MQIKVTKTVPEVDDSAFLKDFEVADRRLFDEFLDMASSGQGGFFPLSESETIADELDEMLALLTPEQRIAFFIVAVEFMNDEGWFFVDVEFLKRKCGVASFELTITG